VSEPGLLRFPVERTQPRRLLPLAELQERFGFSTRWWRYRIADGLPCHRWGGGLRFDPAEVETWLDARASSLLSARNRPRAAAGDRGPAKPDKEV
jgi:hypothetical protein